MSKNVLKKKIFMTFTFIDSMVQRHLTNCLVIFMSSFSIK